MTTAEQLKQMFLKGQGVVTQTPGPAAASVRKYYSYHPGYDIGVNTGTPVYAPAAGQVKNLGVQGGYGKRAAYYDPKSKQTYLLSHLSKVATEGNVKPGSIIGYTGGVPGTYGAGNTTGAHIDIETMGGQPNFASSLARIGTQSRQSFSGPQSRSRVNINELISKAKQKHGKKLRVVGSKNFAQNYVNKKGGKLIKINV
jgi:hypothetical protein